MQEELENSSIGGDEPIAQPIPRLIDIRYVFAPKDTYTDDGSEPATLPPDRDEPLNIDDIDGEDPEESELEGDIEDSLIQCFHQDVQYMINLFEQNIETYYDEEKDVTLLDFRALIQPNPDNPLGLPTIIIRPIDSPLRNTSRYHNGYGSDMYHDDIWKEWEVLASKKPESKRAAIYDLLDRETSKDRYASHIYLQIMKNREGKSIVVIEAGWIYFQRQVALRLRPEQYDLELTPEENVALMRQLSEYNIVAINLGDGTEPVSVDEVILREMMEPLISANAAKLKAVITSRAVSEYINLAYKFLTNPNPDKSSPLYYRFLEYEDLIKNLETPAKKR